MTIKKLTQYLFAVILIGITLASCQDDNDTTYLSFTETDMNLYPGDSHQFKLNAQGASEDYIKSATWSVYKFTINGKLNTTGTVLSIDENGVVTALDYGTAEIKAEFPDGRYVLTLVLVTERPGPNNDELSFTTPTYYMNFGISLSSITLKVDSTLLKKYPLSLTSSDEKYLTVDKEISPIQDRDGYYKVTLHTVLQERTTTPVRITAKLGKAEAYCDVYLDTELTTLTFNRGEDATQQSYKFSIKNQGLDTIKVWYSASPDDKASLNNIKFNIKVSGGGLVVTKHGFNEDVSGQYMIIINTGGLVGHTDVTLEALGKSVTAQCDIYNRNDFNVESIKLPVHDEIIFGAIGSINLDEIKVNPFGITDYWPIEWSSSDPSVATIKKYTTGTETEAQIEFHKLGSVDIIAKAKDKQDVCHYTVKLAIEKINIDSSKGEYFIGETGQWSYKLISKFTNDGRLVPVWTSSNPSVLSIDSKGVVTAKNAGTATITVSVTDEKGMTRTDSKDVTVRNNDNVHIKDVTINSNFVYTNSDTGGGSIIALWNSEDGSDYLTLNISGRYVDTSFDKVYTIGQEISGNVDYVETNENATLVNGTIETKNSALTFNLQAQKGGKTVTIQGTVSTQYQEESYSKRR